MKIMLNQTGIARKNKLNRHKLQKLRFKIHRLSIQPFKHKTKLWHTTTASVSDNDYPVLRPGVSSIASLLTSPLMLSLG